MLRLLRRRSRKQQPSPRDGALIYVAHGDNAWGNAITYRSGEDGIRISGWLERAPFPVVGDVVLLPMQSGRWGKYVFTERRGMTGVSDGFVGYAIGPIDYADEEPQTKACDEFIPSDRMSPYFRV